MPKRRPKKFSARSPAFAAAATGGTLLARVRRLVSLEGPGRLSVGRCLGGALALAAILAIGIAVGVSCSSQPGPQTDFADKPASPPAPEGAATPPAAQLTQLSQEMLRHRLRSHVLNLLRLDRAGERMSDPNNVSRVLEDTAASANVLLRRLATARLLEWANQQDVRARLVELAQSGDPFVKLHATGVLASQARKENIEFLLRIASGAQVLSSSEFERDDAAWALLALGERLPAAANNHSNFFDRTLEEIRTLQQASQEVGPEVLSKLTKQLEAAAPPATAPAPPQVPEGAATPPAAVPVDTPGWVKAVLAAMSGWEMERFDAAPSVVVDAREGYRLIQRKGQKEYLDLERRQRAYSEEELRNAKFAMRYRHLELVVFQGREIPTGAVRKIGWTEWEDELPYFKKVVHLGQGMGMNWYAKATIFDQEQLRQALKLQGGDDRLALLTDALLVEDVGTMTRNSCVHLLAAAGDKAIPYIKSAVEQKKDGWKTIYALAFIQTDAATDYLKELYQAETTRSSATYALVHQPFRRNAKEQYLDMLRQRSRIFEPAQACVQFGWKETIPLLNEVYTQPHSLGEFEAAFRGKRILEGRPVPEEIDQAQQRLKTSVFAQEPMDQDALNRVKATMLASKDTEAAAVIAIRLALFSAKASYDRIQTVRKLGREVLRQLPRKQAEEIVGQLVKSLQANPLYEQTAEDLSGAFSP